MKPLEGRRALVTGAASGIGRATVDALEEAGARVVGLDRVKPSGAPRHFVVADLADEGQVVSGVAEAARHLGGLDILVNNAGIMRESALKDTTAADIDLHFAINVRGAILTAREALRAMGRGGGSSTSHPSLRTSDDRTHRSTSRPKPRCWGSRARGRGSWLPTSS